MLPDKPLITINVWPNVNAFFNNSLALNSANFFFQRSQFKASLFVNFFFQTIVWSSRHSFLSQRTVNLRINTPNVCPLFAHIVGRRKIRIRKVRGCAILTDWDGFWYCVPGTSCREECLLLSRGNSDYKIAVAVCKCLQKIRTFLIFQKTKT